MQPYYKMMVKSGMLCLILVALAECQNMINLTITARALRPKGFRCYITADVISTTTVLFFDGFIYDNMEDAVNFGPLEESLAGAMTKQANGVWLFEDHDVTLTVGNVFRFFIFIPDQFPNAAIRNGRTSLLFNGAVSHSKIYYVEALVDPSDPPPYCKNTVTKVRGRHVCAGDVIFEDNFDTLQESQWQIEHYIPTDHPEYPFVSYQRLTSKPNVFVENGNLHIVPKLQDELMSDHNLAIETGSLDLTDGCTRNECSKVAFGPDILPPIVSGRLTSIPFAFTYGVVYIRAKIPRGDWLYPELLLVPLFKKFVGEKALASILKVVRISDVVAGLKDFTGWNVDQRCYDGGPHKTTEFVRDELSDDFHEFSLRWTPDAIKLFVDNAMYMDSNVWWADPCYKDIESDFRSSLRDYRHLSLGVAAGGSLFPDSIVTDAGHVKPWRNGDAKASLKFWQNKTQWLPTWTAPSLVIDYVKVVALG